MLKQHPFSYAVGEAIFLHTTDVIFGALESGLKGVKKEDVIKAYLKMQEKVGFFKSYSPCLFHFIFTFFSIRMFLLVRLLTQLMSHILLKRMYQERSSRCAAKFVVRLVYPASGKWSPRQSTSLPFTRLTLLLAQPFTVKPLRLLLVSSLLRSLITESQK